MVIVEQTKKFMDIWLIDTDAGVELQPVSIHGMLWLQTHFEDEYWDAIASKQVMISLEDAKLLLADARQAGLNVNYLPSLSIAGKSSKRH